MNTWVNIELITAYVLVGAAGILALALPLIKAFGRPSTLLPLGIALGSLLVLFFVSYLAAEDALSVIEQRRGISIGVSKVVGSGLTLMYLLFIAAFGSILYAELSKLFKR